MILSLFSFHSQGLLLLRGSQDVPCVRDRVRDAHDVRVPRLHNVRQLRRRLPLHARDEGAHTDGAHRDLERRTEQGMYSRVFTVKCLFEFGFKLKICVDSAGPIPQK